MNRYFPTWLMSMLLLTGCALKPSQPSTFYVLNVEPNSDNSIEQGKPLHLGLGPLVMPDLLDRPQIVTRTATNEVQLAEFHRWGGELHPEVLRLLAQNLMARLHTDYVAYYPWIDEQPLDVKLGVRIFRFDGELAKNVVLDGVLSLEDAKVSCGATMTGFHIEVPTSDESYSAIVRAMSLSLGKLSDEIASRVREMKKGC